MQGTAQGRAYSSVVPNLNNDAVGATQCIGIYDQLRGNAACYSYATAQCVHNE